MSCNLIDFVWTKCQHPTAGTKDKLTEEAQIYDWNGSTEKIACTLFICEQLRPARKFYDNSNSYRTKNIIFVRQTKNLEKAYRKFSSNFSIKKFCYRLLICFTQFIQDRTCAIFQYISFLRVELFLSKTMSNFIGMKNGISEFFLFNSLRFTNILHFVMY